MKKEKKTKTKKTKKYKIWFVIMVVPILLSVLPINANAENADISTSYITNLWFMNGINVDINSTKTIESDIRVKGTSSQQFDSVTLRYNISSITNTFYHIKASFEIKNKQNGDYVKQINNNTPYLRVYNDTYTDYNLTITEYINRYKYSIDSDVNATNETNNAGWLYFNFNIYGNAGNEIDIDSISLEITYGDIETQEQITVDLSGIESQLDNLNEQINGLTNDDDYIGLNNISMVRVYGVRNDPNNNPTMYTIEDYTVDNNVLKFDTLYTTYQEILRFTFDTVDIKTIQIQLRSNMLLSDGTILRNISDYQPIVSYGIQPPTPNGTFTDIMNRMPINSNPVHYLYTYENDNVNKNNITTLWIRLNMRGVSVTNQIWDIKIKINDIEYQVKISGQNAQDAVSNYESEVNELEPDPIDIEAENSWLESKYQEYLDNIVETYPQYNWFGVVIYDNAIIMSVILLSIVLMGAGFILYGKK